MSHDHVAVVRSLFERFNEGDLDAAATLVTDDFELIDVADGRTFKGPGGLREWLGVFRTALPDARTEIVNVLAEGGRVATEHIGRGTHNGPFVTPAGTIPPTGRRVELLIGEFYELRDGRIARMTVYYDTTAMMRQLGLMPARGSAAEKALTALMGIGVKAVGAVRRG
jgi:steroid delta-isomerase-like uncharacterized protein